MRTFDDLIGKDGQQAIAEYGSRLAVILQAHSDMTHTAECGAKLARLATQCAAVAGGSIDEEDLTPALDGVLGSVNESLRGTNVTATLEGAWGKWRVALAFADGYAGEGGETGRFVIPVPEGVAEKTVGDPVWIRELAPFEFAVHFGDIVLVETSEDFDEDDEDEDELFW